jgi:hypothetical protein
MAALILAVKIYSITCQCHPEREAVEESVKFHSSLFLKTEFDL